MGSDSVASVGLSRDANYFVITGQNKLKYFYSLNLATEQFAYAYVRMDFSSQAFPLP